MTAFLKFLWTLLLVLSAALLGAAWGPLRAQQALQWVQQQELTPLLCLSRLDAALKNARAHVNAGYVHDPTDAASALHEHPITLHTDAIRHGVQEARQFWKAYRAAPHESDTLPLIAAVDQGLNELIEQTLVPSAEALDAARYAEAAAAVTKTYLSYQRTEVAILALQQRSEQRVQRAITGLEEERAQWQRAAALAALLGLSLAMAALRGLRPKQST